jgi:hypothetical protein
MKQKVESEIEGVYHVKRQKGRGCKGWWSWEESKEVRGQEGIKEQRERNVQRVHVTGGRRRQ